MTLLDDSVEPLWFPALRSIREARNAPEAILVSLTRRALKAKELVDRFADYRRQRELEISLLERILRETKGKLSQAEVETKLKKWCSSSENLEEILWGP